jgi:hypothetical protein
MVPVLFSRFESRAGAAISIASSTMAGVAQLVRASDCGSEGRGFKSHHSPHANPYRKVGFCNLRQPPARLLGLYSLIGPILAAVSIISRKTSISTSSRRLKRIQLLPILALGRLPLYSSAR